MAKLTKTIATSLPERFRIQDDKTFSLSSTHTAETLDIDKDDARAWVRSRKTRLADLQERLAAEKARSVLLVLQGMDTSGKDSMIRHVLSGVNPQGVKVVSFKKPSEIEMEHGFLWRVHAAVPGKGQLGVFNRSHYEDVLIARVHADTLNATGLEGNPHKQEFWNDRLRDIRHFEAYLERQGMVVIKIMLHISPERQKKRLLKRLSRPEKRWKFDESDLAERGFWNAYQQAYEDAIAGTATSGAPWMVIPSDHKWFARLIVMETLIATLEKLSPEPPPPSEDILSNLKKFEQAVRSSEI